MKKNKKINMLIAITVLFLTISLPIFATNAILNSTDLGPDISGMAGDEVPSRVNEILGYVLWAAWAITIGMCIYVGIKYMMSSAQERARVKESLIRVIIGALVISGSTSLFYIIMNAITGSLGTGS